MNLEQIKEAVEAGKIVCWANSSYQVIKDDIGQWLIHRAQNDWTIGLTHQDGTTLNGAESQFYILE